MNEPGSMVENKGITPNRRVLLDACLIVVFGALCGICSNLFRSAERIEWVQHKPYDIVVPCPEPVGRATAIAPNHAKLLEFTTLVMDARSPEEFAEWHLPGAINVPFDWLGPPVQAEVEQLAKRVAASHSAQLVVYGDGDNPDSGREWARLLAGGGIRNIAYVEGGAPALRKLRPNLPQPVTTPSATPSSSTTLTAP